MMSGTDMTVSVMPVAVIRLVYIVGGACASGRHLPSAGNESDDETVITMAWSKGLKGIANGSIGRTRRCHHRRRPWYRA